MIELPQPVSPLEAAREYVRRGWRVVPIPFKRKGAKIDDWGKMTLTEADLPAYFDQPANIGLILGEPSGWLVDVDLDCPEAIEIAEQYLPPTPAVTGRPSKPRSHYWYYAPGAVTDRHADPVTHKMIAEFRSTGVQTVVGPSIHPDDREAYEILTAEPATVSAPMLAACVEALAKRVIKMRHGTLPAKPEPARVTNATSRVESPTDLERRALAYLAKLPPAISGQGGHPATYAAATALVHGFGLDSELALTLLLQEYNPRCEPPWSEKELRHKVEDAASKSHSRPHGWLRDQERESPPAEDASVDISTLVAKATNANRPTPHVELAVTNEPDEAPVDADPGPIPDRLLYVPGFVDDVTRFTLETAPYPNRPLAFISAIALLGTLTGRKIRESGNVRTNVQILALASSGVGKDWPRKINANILLHAGEARKFAGKSASGEGIEDRLIRHPIILKQDDEIDTLFENMRDNKEARYRNQFSMLLELYGEAGAWRAVRDKAGTESTMINNPHLVLLGTTTPTEFYSSLSSKMLNKGLLARLIAVEAGERGPRKRADWRVPPDHIIEAAKAWSTFRPPEWGNLSDESTVKAEAFAVPFTDDAHRIMERFAAECDAAYRDAYRAHKEPVMAIWARAAEKATQLALIYACSVHGTEPVIELPAVSWASEFIKHTILRTLYMLGEQFHESEFEQRCQAVMSTLNAWRREHGDDWMPYRDVARKHRWSRRDHDAVRETLVDQELIDTDIIKTVGRPRLVYRAHAQSKSGGG